jgi:hypothetical protein
MVFLFRRRLGCGFGCLFYFYFRSHASHLSYTCPFGIL